MVDGESIARLARKLGELYEGVELSVLLMVATRLKRGLASEQWAARRLGEAAVLDRQARRLVDRLRRSREAEITALVAGAHLAGESAAAATFKRARISAVFAHTPSTEAAAALARDLSGRLAAGDLRILRAPADIYRQVIGRVTAQGLADEFTRRGAAQAALNLFADHGVTGFVDAAGRSWDLASYSEMAARTAAHQAARQGTLDAVRAAGRDLVIVGGSPSCCDACAPWEGRVLSLDGTTPGHPTLAEAEAAGLFHPNCGHAADPYIEGLTDTRAIQHGDANLYAARQEQRDLERGVRQWKKRETVALDDVRAQQARAKVRERQGKLREHVEANDLKRLRYREQIGKAI